MRKSERRRTLSHKAQLNAKAELKSSVKGHPKANENQLPENDVLSDPLLNGSSDLTCPGSCRRKVTRVNSDDGREERTTRRNCKMEEVESASEEGNGGSLEVSAASTSTPRKARKRGLVEENADTQSKKRRLDNDYNLEIRTSGCGQCCSEGGLCSQFPGRRVQMHLLMQLLSGERLPPCLYVYGSSSSGKSLLLTNLLPILQLKYAVVNCQECYCPEILFTQILHQLSSNSTAPSIKCHTLQKFLSCFKQLPCMKGSSHPVAIVLDHADHLRDDHLLLAAFQKLSELSGSSKVCVIMVSALAMDRFFLDMELGPYSVVPVHFTPYSKEETLEIMAMDCPTHQPLPFFKTFVRHIWNVFQSVCLDLSELRSLCCSLYPHYVQPVERGEVTYQESRYLWRCIQPYFKTVMNKIYLTELSCEEHDLVLKLPFYAKYLLLASYLASNNPSKTDKRFFSKLKQPKVHKSHRKTAAAEHNGQLVGPKDFSLDRMMAIFHSIVTGPVVAAAQLYTQVSTLVRLQLLSQSSRSGTMDLPRYKCLMALGPAKELAREVGFNLIHYLHDFNS